MGMGMGVRRVLRRILKWGAWGSLAVLLSAFALASFVLMTEAGARLALKLAMARLDLPITYGDVSGSIAGRLEVHDLGLEIDGFSALIDHLAVEWRLLELRHGRVHIEEVQISGARSILRPEAFGGAPDSTTVESQTSEPREDDRILPFEMIVDSIRLQDAAFAVAEIVEAYGINLDGSGTIDAFSVGGRLVADLPEFGTAILEISGAGSQSGVELSVVNADVLDGRLQAEGSVAWTPAVEWRVDIQADDLAPGQLASSPADWPGRLSFSGTTEGSAGDTLHLRIQLDTLSGVLRDIPLNGKLSGSIQGEYYSLSALALDWGPTHVRGAGEIGERLDAVFELDAPDLSAVLPDSRGSVLAEGRIAGTRSAPRIDANLIANGVEVGGIRIEDGDADVDVNWAPGQANRVRVHARGVQVAGQTAETVVVEAQGTREEHTVAAHTTGERLDVRLEAAGGLSGWAWAGLLRELEVDTETMGSWVLEGETSLNAAQSEVDVSGFCIGSDDGRLCADGVWRAEEEWHASASVEGIPLALAGTFLPERLELHGLISGNVEASASIDGPMSAEVILHADSGAIVLDISDTTQSMAFENTELAVFADPDTTVGRLRLEVPGDKSAGPGLLIADVRLSALTGLRGESGAGLSLLEDGRVALSIDGVPMSLAEFILPGEATISGTLDGKVEATTEADGSITAEAELRPGPGEITYSSGGGRRSLDYEQGSILLDIGQSGLDGEWSLAWGDPDSATFAAFSGDLRLPEYTNLDQDIESQRLEARVEGGWDLRVIDALSDEFSASAGRLDVKLSASGTLAEPNLTGAVNVSGQTEVTNLGIRLSEIEVTATADAARQLQVVGHAASGDGRISIEGMSPLIPSETSPGRIFLRGDRFLAVNTEQARVEVSPEVEILLTGRQIQVSGDVSIPAARIDILEIPVSAVPVSRDVVLVGQEEEDRKDLPISANIRVVLGDEVSFRGFGVTTRLLGTVAVTESPGRPTRGSGELVFSEGIYRGYGQNLQIDPGRLVFAGPIDNPGLDVRAYRTATDRTRAGLLLRGTLKEPDVQVWSDPVMSQSEALAYMLFGRSMEEGSENDQANAASAAAALGGSMLAMSMASQVGLDEARIETGSKREDAAFVAGKYLSPRLFVAYGIGLYEPINTLRVRYLLSQKFTLQTVTGDRTATDILYRIER